MATCYKTVDAGIFPRGQGYWRTRRPEYDFCNSPHCGYCINRMGTPTIHTHCLQLFMGRCHTPDRLARLWVAATRRFPWIHNPLPAVGEMSPRRFLRLLVSGGHRERPPDGLSVHPYSRSCVENALGLSGMRILPQHVVDMIFARIPPRSCLLCYNTVLHLIDKVSPGSRQCRQQDLVCPISQIRFWSRGDKAEMATVDQGGQSAKPLVRLTVDFWGLRMIERIPNTKEPAHNVTGCMFAVVQVDKLSEATAKFKVRVNTWHAHAFADTVAVGLLPTYTAPNDPRLESMGYSVTASPWGLATDTGSVCPSSDARRYHQYRRVLRIDLFPLEKHDYRNPRPRVGSHTCHRYAITELPACTSPRDHMDICANTSRR